MNQLSVSNIPTYNPISIPTMPNPGEINFADKLNQVLNKNKLLQKKTQRSFAEIRAEFGSKKKTPKKPKKSPLIPKKKPKEKNSSEDSDESASKIIQRFLAKTEGQNNQNQNPNKINTNNANINTNNTFEDKSTDKSDKSINNNQVLNNTNNNIINNTNIIPEKTEKKTQEQIDNNNPRKSVTKLEKPKPKEKEKEIRTQEPETTETQIDLSVPDPNAPNEIVLEEEIEEEIEDDEENEVEELESSVSEVDLSNIPENENGIHLSKNKRLKKGLSNNDNIMNPLPNNINIISNTTPIPIEIPQANTNNIISEITQQNMDMNNMIPTITPTIPINQPPIINNPSAVNMSNISPIPIPNISTISPISIISPQTQNNIPEVNNITNNINLMNTMNPMNNINEPRKYIKKHNKNLFIMNNGINNINNINTINNEINPVTPPIINTPPLSNNVIMNKFNHFNNIAIQKNIKETNPEEIEREFYEVMNGQESANDRLIYSINFFMDQGFTENVRYVFYENLMNLGLPINGNFNKFYQTFIANCGQNQRDIPCKIAAEFYFEFIFKILVDNISEAKQRYISDFFFNGNKYETIRNNFNLITYVRELIAENEINLFNFIMDKYDSLFKDIVINNIKINTGFRNYKSIISKMLSNVIVRCDRHGYLNFRQYIDNERIIFDGLKIKDNNTFGHGKFNVKKMISIKVFGQELTNKKFNDIIKEFFLYLFSHFNYADVMKNK